VPTVIKYENWDGVTAPAIPFGWSVSTPIVTTASPGGGIGPISSPNVLACPSQLSATNWAAVWGTVDGAGGNVELLGYHGLALDSWYTGGARRTSLRNPFILNLLQTNALIVTARTKKICAHYALSQICEDMIQSAGNPSRYQGMAARHRSEAQRMLTTYTAELQVNNAVDSYGNPLAAIPINFSSTNTLWA